MFKLASKLLKLNLKNIPFLISLSDKLLLKPLRLISINWEFTLFEINSKMETLTKGIYAIGNVADYPGKVKMLVTSFGESSIAIGSVVSKIFPGKKMSYYVKKKEN